MSRKNTRAAVTIAGFVLATLAVVPASLAADAPQSPAVLAWTGRAPFPVVATRGLGAFFRANGKFYVLGGRTSDTAGSDLQSIREYDPATNAWATKGATMPTNQVNNMVGGVLRINGTPYIVAVGGSAAGQTTGTADVRAYDPIADSMIPLALDPWPGGLSGTNLPGGAAVYNNKLYVFGGFNINVAMLNGIWCFDPDLAPGARWSTQTSTLPTPLGYLPTAASGAHIYTLGGSTYEGGLLIDSNLAFRYDPATDTITPVTSVPRAVGETQAVTESDGTIYVMGGGRTAPNPSALVDVYDPILDSWSAGPAMATARRNFPVGINPVSGDIWVVGGYAPSVPTDAHENLTEGRIFADGYESGSFCDWSVVPDAAYGFARDGFALLVPGTTDSGNHADDASTTIALPFPYVLYDQLFNDISVGSNGHLTFGTVNSGFNLPCMPVPTATYAIGPFWTDQCTAACGSTLCTGCGIFTSTSGTAPSRVFNIEYRTKYFNSGVNGVPLSYEVRLYEGQRRFDVLYDTVNPFDPPSAGALNVGVQFGPTGPFTSVGCDPDQGLNPPVASGEIYIYRGCTPPH